MTFEHENLKKQPFLFDYKLIKFFFLFKVGILAYCTLSIGIDNFRGYLTILLPQFQNSASSPV